jgi:acetylornithine/succinyldiaminopimelate/putrescine aminotransferase
VIVEPVQGEAGIFPIDEAVVLAAREACDAVGALLAFDEIQSGMGRTGSLWAYQQLPVIPDVITTAKAVGGGLPVGACVTAPALGDVLERGDHGSTFAGAPIAAAAALAALEVIDDPELLRRTRELGARFMRALAELDPIAEVRGRGLMVGVTLEPGIDAAQVAGRALEQGLVINVPGPGMLRFLPPLTIGAEDVDRASAIIARVLR